MAVRHWSAHVRILFNSYVASSTRYTRFYDVAFFEAENSRPHFRRLFVPLFPQTAKFYWFSNFKLFSPSPYYLLHQPSFINTMASHPETKIDCSKVYVKQSSFSNEQTGMFDGAFALVDIKEGELVEKGVMRRLPEGFDGNTCPYIFTWSTERPNKVNMI